MGTITPAAERALTIAISAVTIQLPTREVPHFVLVIALPGKEVIRLQPFETRAAAARHRSAIVAHHAWTMLMELARLPVMDELNQAQLERALKGLGTARQRLAVLIAAARPDTAVPSAAA